MSRMSGSGCANRDGIARRYPGLQSALERATTESPCTDNLRRTGA